jgi:hypothetical protein
MLLIMPVTAYQRGTPYLEEGLATDQPEGILAGATDQTGVEMTWTCCFGASTHPEDCAQP